MADIRGGLKGVPDDLKEEREINALIVDDYDPVGVDESSQPSLETIKKAYAIDAKDSKGAGPDIDKDAVAAITQAQRDESQYLVKAIMLLQSPKGFPLRTKYGTGRQAAEKVAARLKALADRVETEELFKDSVVAITAGRAASRKKAFG